MCLLFFVRRGVCSRPSVCDNLLSWLFDITRIDMTCSILPCRSWHWTLEHVWRRSAAAPQRERSPPQLFDECKEIFFFLLLIFREPDPTGSGNLHLWVPPPALSHPQSTCTCRHFLNRCPHLPGTTAKPAVITCVKTRVQGITEGNRAIYKLLADCFKGCGSCTM